MLRIPQILVSSVALATSAVAVVGAGVIAAGLSGCGQQGSLYLPTEPAAARRATLPETLRPGSSSATPPSVASPASAPVPQYPSTQRPMTPP